MLRVALRMLTSDRGKYLGLVVVITFACLLIAQQASIFCGVLRMTTSRIRDVEDAPIWVMNPAVEYLDEVKPLRDTDLYRIRGVTGVQWAVRHFFGHGRAKLEAGSHQEIILVGIDDQSRVAAPRELLLGNLDDLSRHNAILIDDRGYRILWPGEPLRTGRTLEINNRRGTVVGICRTSLPFESFPVVFMRYSQIHNYFPRERKLMSFVLASGAPGASRGEICRRISEQTGLLALSSREFAWNTIYYYLTETGIPINFAITVLLGFLVGTAVAGQTFYLFMIENLKQFAVLKAMGTSNRQVVGMVLIQALLVGLIGYGLGVGLAAVFGQFTEQTAKLAYYMPWPTLAVTGGAVVLIVLCASLIGVRRVLSIDPAIVFKS